jgi:hypothetical protein
MQLMIARISLARNLAHASLGLTVIAESAARALNEYADAHV